MRRLLALPLATLIAGTGCLGQTYRIPKKDLAQLTQTAPEARGEKVRVVQSYYGSDDPPPAGRDRDSGTSVIIIGHTHTHSHHDHHSGSGGGGSSGGGSVAGAPTGKKAAEDSRFWIIVAVAAGIALAATEGARYDGWVKLHPMHPVHLYGPYGGYQVVALSQLTPEHAAWAYKAVVRETEGPFVRLGRAPLNRVGFNYSILLGYAQIPSANGEEDQGFMGHIEFGVYPTQEVGIVADIGLGWRNNELDLVTFDGRYALGLRLFPVMAGGFSAGGYGEIGFATRLEDGPPGRDNSSRLLAAGVMAQLELTTRLTLTGRAGLSWLHGERVNEFALGLSIY